MSSTKYPPLSLIGEFKQHVALEPMATIPPTYKKITPAQRQILEYAKNGNTEGIRKMAETLSNLTRRNRIKSEIIDCADELGWTPIMWAIEGGHAECITALCEAGADTNKWSLHQIFDNDDVPLNPLMYAVMLVTEGRTSIECVRALLAFHKAQEQTKRNYLIRVQGRHMSALTIAIEMANHQFNASHLSLIKLLLDNHVRIRAEDFKGLKLHNTKILELLLDQLLLDAERLTVPDDYIDLLHVLDLEHIDNDKHLYESGKLIIDYLTSKKLMAMFRRLEGRLEAPTVWWNAFVDDGGDFFLASVNHQIVEFVQACIDKDVPWPSRTLTMDGKITANSWDILRRVLAYVDDIVFDEVTIKSLIHREEFLIDNNVDIDVLSDVSTNICEWGNDKTYYYETQISQIRKVLPKNLDFAIKHGFAPVITNINPSFLVCVHDQTQFVKALFFMKILPIVIDLNTETYRFPKTNINTEEIWLDGNTNCRIQNGSVVDAEDVVLDKNSPLWKSFDFTAVKISEGKLPLEKGNIVTIQLDSSKMTGKLIETPTENGWYSFKGIKIQTKRENVSLVELPAYSVIMNANLHLLNVSLLENTDIDEFDFGDDYWTVQSAETLGQLMWGHLSGESILPFLLTHRWNLSDVYVQDDIFTIIQQFVDRGAYIPKDFCQILLDNASDYTVWIDEVDQDTLYDAKKIYHLLKENCDNATEPIFSKFAADYTQYIEQPRKSMSEFFIPLYEQLEFFEYILGEEKPKDLPLTPIFIPKICQMVQEGNYEPTKKKLSDFLVHALSPESPSKDPQYIAKCVELMLAAEFDPNGVTEQYEIPLSYVLKSGNYLVLKILLNDPRLEPNKNDNVQVTALEKILLSPTFSAQDTIMIQTMLDFYPSIPIPFEQRPYVQKLLTYSENINVGIKAIIGNAAKGLEYDLQDVRQNIGGLFEDSEVNLDKLAGKILTVMEKIRPKYVECPFRQHTLPAPSFSTVANAPKLVDFLLRRKYFDGPQDKPSEWYFDPNTTVPLYELGVKKEELEEQGIEPQWQNKENYYTKQVRTRKLAAMKVVHWRGLALRHLPWEMRNSYMVVKAAVRSNGLALQFVTTEQMMSWEYVIDAVVQNWRAFQFLPRKAIYEKVKESVPLEFYQGLFKRRTSERVLSVKLNNAIKDMFKQVASEGSEYDILDIIEIIKDTSTVPDFDTLAKQISIVMGEIRAKWVSEPYEYSGLPSQSCYPFVIWMYESLFQKGDPHEGEWSEFEKMFPEAAAYADMNPYTDDGEKQIEDKRKELELKHIQDLSVHAGEKVDIVHWDDFEPVMFGKRAVL